MLAVPASGRSKVPTSMIATGDAKQLDELRRQLVLSLGCAPLVQLAARHSLAGAGAAVDPWAEVVEVHALLAAEAEAEGVDQPADRLARAHARLKAFCASELLLAPSVVLTSSELREHIVYELDVQIRLRLSLFAVGLGSGTEVEPMGRKPYNELKCLLQMLGLKLSVLPAASDVLEAATEAPAHASGSGGLVRGDSVSEAGVAGGRIGGRSGVGAHGVGAGDSDRAVSSHAEAAAPTASEPTAAAPPAPLHGSSYLDVQVGGALGGGWRSLNEYLMQTLRPRYASALPRTLERLTEEFLATEGLLVDGASGLVEAAAAAPNQTAEPPVASEATDASSAALASAAQGCAADAASAREAPVAGLGSGWLALAAPTALPGGILAPAASAAGASGAPATSHASIGMLGTAAAAAASSFSHSTGTSAVTGGLRPPSLSRSLSRSLSAEVITRTDRLSHEALKAHLALQASRQVRKEPSKPKLGKGAAAAKGAADVGAEASSTGTDQYSAHNSAHNSAHYSAVTDRSIRAGKRPAEGGAKRPAEGGAKRPAEGDGKRPVDAAGPPRLGLARSSVAAANGLPAPSALSAASVPPSAPPEQRKRKRSLDTELGGGASSGGGGCSDRGQARPAKRHAVVVAATPQACRLAEQYVLNADISAVQETPAPAAGSEPTHSPCVGASRAAARARAPAIIVQESPLLKAKQATSTSRGPGVQPGRNDW